MSDPTPLDIATRHQVLLERLKSGVVADISRSLGSTGESVGLILGAVDAVSLRDMPRASVDALAADLGAAVSAGAAPIVDAVLATSGEVAADTAGYEAQLVQSVAVGRNIVVPPAAQVAAAIEAAPLFSGALLDPFVRDWQANAADAVAREVYAGYARGDTLADLKRAIRGTRAARYQDGLVQGVTARQAEAIARTSIQHAASVGRMELYKANPDIIKRYRWLSTLDGRTSAICRSLSGRVFDVGSGPQPPAHINCRSQIIPEVAGADRIRKITQQASMDGPVSADLNYYDWLKTQPGAYQDDVIGPKRGALLRNGGLSSDEFAKLQLGRDFRPLTLDEMRAKMPSAFTRAGI